MQKILRIIKEYKEYFTFVLLIIVSLFFISIGDITKLNGFRTIIIGTVGWLQDAFSWIPDTGALETENKALRKLNLQLSNEVTKMRTSVIQNQKLRTMINLKDKIQYQTVPAEVVGRSNIEMRNFYSINKGVADSLREGMAVRSDAGLVGTLTGITDSYSLVELVMNKNVKISSIVERSRYPGILTWEGGEYFSLKNIPKSYDVQLGDTILTSNYSNKYPANIPIGWVAKKAELPGDIYIRIDVKPFVNFATLEQVFVIKFVPDEERLKLIKEIDEKLKYRKGNY